MFQIGRLCTKIAGRDANKKCVIVEVLDNNYVIIDGETRRRKCNIQHLVPSAQKFDIANKSSRDDVKALFEKELQITLKDTKPKEKKEKPVKVRKADSKVKAKK